MPATIQTPKGKARIVGGVWHAADKEVEKQLNALVGLDLRTPGVRDSDKELAEIACALFGGTMTEHEPMKHIESRID